MTVICLLITSAMVAIAAKYRQDLHRERAGRASNKRVLREYEHMALHNPEKIVTSRRDLYAPRSTKR